MIILDTQFIKSRKEKEEILVSGNGAIARGIIEAGVKVITSYPGTPCAEVIENLASVSDEFGFYVEWSVNEKVALEVAAAAAMSNVRSAFITKHVGINVASDALMHICYAGVNGGMVIVSADDPGASASPIEEDTRFYARMAEILALEPSDQQEAKDMVAQAFDISEKIKLPVFIRATNRIFYGRGRVITGEVQSIKSNARFEKRNPRWFIAGKNAVKQHQWLHGQQGQLTDISEKSLFNKTEWAKEKGRGIITAGVSYYYAKEAINELSAADKISILKLGIFNPMPRNYIKQFLREVNEVLIIEELEPFIEESVKSIASEIDKNIKIYGKLTGHFSHTDSYSPEIIKKAIAQLWLNKNIASLPKDYIKKVLSDLLSKIAQRPINFCPGCPHRASMYILKKAIKNQGEENFIVTGDIGCYTLGKEEPFFAYDAAFCMGASIGIGCGLAQVKTGQRIVATIGDSTFLHAGIPALINCCYTGVDILIYILDNGTVAMTGLQPYPGIGLSATGTKTKIIKIEDIVKACNVDYVEIVDPFQVDETVQILSDALIMKGQRVIISRHECAQMKNKKSSHKLIEKKYSVNEQRCKQCKICIDVLACPAIAFKKGNIFINDLLCSGCDVCSQVCPNKAIIF